MKALTLAKILSLLFILKGSFIWGIEVFFSCLSIQNWKASPDLQMMFQGDFLRYFLQIFVGLIPLIVAGTFLIISGILIYLIATLVTKDLFK